MNNVTNRFIVPNRKYLAGLILLVFVTILFKLPVFFLSHNNNDELIHLSLAMKIEKHGLDVFKEQRYNLFFVDRGFNPKNHLIGVKEGKKRIGSLLEGFLGEREELSHHPPALPFFLGLSHRIFTNNSLYLANISNNIYFMLRNAKFQFYSCLVQFLFSIFFVLSVYFLGSIFFSHKVGLISAFFLNFTPIELLTSNKIWADDMTAFFVVLAVIFYLYALKNNSPIFSLLAGLSCGVLSRQSSIA